MKFLKYWPRQLIAISVCSIYLLIIGDITADGADLNLITFVSATAVILCSWLSGFFYSFIYYFIVTFMSIYLISVYHQDNFSDLISNYAIPSLAFKLLVATTMLSLLRAINQKYITELEQRKKTEYELKTAMDKLQKSNHELQQFAYAASHDLKEPLRTISSYLALLSKRYKGQLDQDGDDFIHFTVDAAKRMSLLIDNLLTYSRVQTRQPKFETIDCNRLVEDVITQLVTAIEEQKAEVRFHDLPTIYADRLQMLQLFQNLISNGIKFHKPDVLPTVFVQFCEKSGEFQFAVTDNGIGISNEDFERMFVIFQRLNTQQEFSGSGIGLAICKRIVDRYGGKIWLESVPDQGSTFYFTLPKQNVLQDSEAPVENIPPG